MDGGAYCTLTPVVLSRGAIHAGGPYRCPNVRIRARATRTNTPPNGAFRGFGAPQTEFAAEIQIDRLAEALGMSPLEIRRRNLYQARRHDADRPGPARERRRRRRSSSAPPRRPSSRASARGRRAARARRAGAGVVPGVAAHDRAAIGSPRGSGSRSPGTAPGSPARARSSSRRSPRSSSPPTAGSGS